MPPEVRTALADGYGGEWSCPRALALLKRDGDVGPVRALAEAVNFARQPVAREPLRQRLSALGMTMAPNRAPAEATVWLNETMRLLGDLPQDILFEAIDALQKTSKFLTTVAEIREIAEPKVAARAKDASRLEAMARYLASGQPIPTLPSRPAPQPKAPEKPITAEEMEELNAMMKRAGCYTRWRDDGSSYQLKTKESLSGAPRHEGPPRKPTRQDYIDLGVDPAVLDSMKIGEAEPPPLT